MPHLSKRWWRSTSTTDSVETPAYSQHDQSSDPEYPKEALSLLQDETAEPDLWRKALMTVQAETKWPNFLNEIHVDDRKTLDCVNSIQSEALERAKSTKTNERGFHLPGGRIYTYRQIYENVATYANKFQIVGDLLVQADPGYATVPWSLIRFGITTLNYLPRIETHSNKSVIVYSGADHKIARTLAGLNPVSADENMKLYNTVNDAMKKVDHDIALVYGDVSQKEISGLLVGQSQQLSTIMDGILAVGRSINSRIRIGRTAFFEATAMGHNDIARILLDSGTNWFIPNDNRMTVLHKITHEGDDSNFMAYLLEKAYNESTASQFNDFLNAKNNLGRTALMAAVIRNRVSCVELLLDCGADWSLDSNSNTTALHFACWEGHELVLTLLLIAAQTAEKERFESFLNHRNDDGKTALLDAVERNRPSFVKQLLDVGADYAITRLNGENALHIGSFRGHKEAVELVLEKASLDNDKTKLSTILNGRNDKGKTALMDAAETNQPAIIELLLRHGADYTLQDNDGFTALHYCSVRNHGHAVERLLDLASLDSSTSPETNEPRFQTFVNQRSHTHHASALRDSAIRGHVELVDLLLNTYHADYTCVGVDGNTTLHSGVQGGFVGVVDKVLDCGKRDKDGERFQAFLRMRNKDGKTAWVDAVEGNRVGMKEKLEKVGGDVE